jgi:hypothetical protein
MEPMNLKKLPEHLKKLREKGEFDENLVVDMGKISPSIKYPRAGIVFLLFFLFSLFSLSTINFLQNKSITIVLNANEIDQKTLTELLSKSGAKIISVKEAGDFYYEVEVKKLNNLKEFIEKLKKNKSLKNVELKTID